MQTKSVNIHSLGLSDTRSLIITLVMIAGNIVLPQICHLVPNGGFIFLPIYFFTLVAAYKYGWKVGLLTAICSPLINHALFGMPPAGALAAILIKSITLAVAASAIAGKTGRVTLLAVAASVLAYQGVGAVAEWAITADINMAMADFTIGLPGIALQIFGGWALMKFVKF